jgi:phosphoglycerate dehydrogenase-like enzyme
VKVFSAQRENSIPVAEFVLGQLLLSNKGYFQSQNEYRRGFWRLGFMKARALSRDRPGNVGAKVGIVGLGTIGSLLAEMLKPFDLQVIVYDPFVDDDKVQLLGATRVSLEELFETSDVISNHLPDIANTRGLLDYRYFSMMKSTATFINTGRGRQVDEKGLAKALRECPSRSALLDVTCAEPPNPFSRLYRARNIFLSPHIAGSQGNEIHRLYHASLRQYLEFRES